MKKLVVDLGHGASDPGAIGQAGTCEANIVLGATRCNMKSIA
ncbi:N-acetylmuramoyl-L-alanine amidase [Cetobacterium sp. ZOR0034]|nr:N-acetylmuramoyl-L-alanine amidase [Cetobacterium sp. ZOR0034]